MYGFMNESHAYSQVCAKKEGIMHVEKGLLKRQQSLHNANECMESWQKLNGCGSLQEFIWK